MTPRKPRSDKGKARKRTDWKPPKAEPAKEQINGILVRLVPGENQAQSLEIQALGDVKLAELPTLLRMAAQTTENQLLGGN